MYSSFIYSWSLFNFLKINHCNSEKNRYNIVAPDFIHSQLLRITWRFVRVPKVGKASSLEGTASEDVEK